MIMLRINCGCGFQSTDLRDAQAHSNNTGHKLEIGGQVEPEIIKEYAQ